MTKALRTYTKKQNEILKRALVKDWFMMINHGAVRAGKTVLDNDLFLMELLRVKELATSEDVDEPMYILAAFSSSTLKSNILHEITNKYGIEFKFDQNNNFKLFGVKVITTFTMTVSGIGAIRGLTAYGAYVNEASLANKLVFDEIIKRCSGNGARIIADTNPDHPEHWLKKDYIDKADDDKIVANHFTIFDNNFLNQRYIDNVINATPSGTLTDRGIYGLWTIGEGAIYSDFDEKEQLLASVEGIEFERYVCGVDWGYEHYGTMVVLGIDYKGNYYLLEENAHQHLHIDEWLAIGKQISRRYGPRIPFYCDSARPEYVDTLYYAGLNASNANKAVLPGISEVGRLIKERKFFALDTLKKFKEEINQYVWSKKGDAPSKEQDDVLDAVRYAIYTDITDKENSIVA